MIVSFSGVADYHKERGKANIGKQNNCRYTIPKPVPHSELPRSKLGEYTPGIPNSFARTGPLAGSIPLPLQSSLPSFSAGVLDLNSAF